MALAKRECYRMRPPMGYHRPIPPQKLARVEDQQGVAEDHGRWVVGWVVGLATIVLVQAT